MEIVIGIWLICASVLAICLYAKVMSAKNKLETEVKQLKSLVEQLKTDNGRRDETLIKLKEPAVTHPLPLQCWFPDGTCMNPYRDCVNCPRHFGGGITINTTGTNINKQKE